jgi:hypothetical protein
MPKNRTPVALRRVAKLTGSAEGVRGFAYPKDVPLLVQAATDEVLVGSSRLPGADAPTLPCWLLEADERAIEALRDFDQARDPRPSQTALAAAAMQRVGLLLSEIRSVLGVSDVATASRWAALATMPPKVLQLLDARHITFGHARLLIGLGETRAEFLVGECVAYGWTNDQLRQAIRGEAPPSGPDATAYAQALTQRLGTECLLLWPDSPGKRRLVIEYFDTEALKGVFEQLARGPEGPRRNLKRQLEIGLVDVDELESLTAHLSR